MTIKAKYPGRCSICQQAISVGQQIEWKKGERPTHVACANDVTTERQAQPKRTDHPPTVEQSLALEHFASGESLKIEAGAGTGKTTTLKMLAESTSRRGQYIAFNKAIVVESGEKMPETVNCSTAHSLAFRHIGHRYAHRLNSGRMRSLDIANRLGIDPISIEINGAKKTLQKSYLAGVVMQSVVRFCQTADETPGWKNVPYIRGIDETVDGVRSYVNNNLVARWIEEHIVAAWADLMNVDGALPFRHDHYLKAWQLDDPKIGADYILFDEAQDANPVMVAVVAAQAEHAQLVWVGDSQQQIYTFTGAVNALASMPSDHTTFLTQSFRFGTAVAEQANRILEMLNAELRIRGTESINSVVGTIDQPDTILTRTNAAAVRAVLDAQASGQRPHLVGGGSEIVAFAKAADRLALRQPAEHPELACFESWNEVREYVQSDEQGSELRLLVKLVDDFTTPVILGALESMVPESRADLIVSTAHKSKGREWDRVRLGDDFPEKVKNDEELRLLYVACTRAKQQLDISAVALLNGVVT